MYYEGYCKIYDIGSSIFTGHGTPSNLTTEYDTENYYCYNVNKIYNLNGFYPPNSFGYLGFPIPNWYAGPGNGINGSNDYKYNQMYFQQNWRNHIYDD